MLRPSNAAEGRSVSEQERPFRDSEVNKTTGSQTVDTRDAILNGTLPVSQEDAIMLAGIQCQIQFGDHDKHKHKPGLFETKDFLPKEYCKVKGIEKKIFLEHKKWAGYSEQVAKVKYTQQCRTLKTYGYTFFLVEEEVKGKSKPVPILLGINKGGIIRVNEKTKKIMKTWPLTTVKRYDASLNSFTLDFGDYADQYYSVQTQEGEEISALISGYIEINLRQKVEEKSWHTLKTSEEQVQGQDPRSMPGYHGYPFMDPIRMAAMYPPNSRERLELELERDKQERDAQERELREHELRSLEMREKLKAEMEMKPPGQDPRSMPGYLGYPFMDPIRMAAMYPPNSRERLELELERDKQERDAQERELREHELRSLEMREKLKAEMEMKPQGQDPRSMPGYLGYPFMDPIRMAAMYPPNSRERLELELERDKQERDAQERELREHELRSLEMREKLKAEMEMKHPGQDPRSMPGYLGYPFIDPIRMAAIYSRNSRERLELELERDKQERDARERELREHELRSLEMREKLKAEMEMKHPGQDPRSMPGYLGYPFIDPIRMAAIYSRNSRERLELELERDKQERDARERELREHELRSLEMREKLKAEMEMKPPGQDPRSMPGYLGHPFMDPIRMAAMYPPNSRERLELELERDKRERDARERELREHELRSLEMREKLKAEMEMKPPGQDPRSMPGYLGYPFMDPIRMAAMYPPNSRERLESELERDKQERDARERELREHELRSLEMREKLKAEMEMKSPVPEELLTPRDVDLYWKAIKEGKERDKLVRVMVVGHYAQGKTSLTKRLFGQSVEGVESTNGIEVHSKRCYENGSHWKSKPSVEHVDDMTSRLVNVATQLLDTEEQDSGDITDIANNSGPAEDSTEPMTQEDSALSLDSKENSAISLDSKKDSATALDSKEVSAISFDYKKDNAISLNSKKDFAISLDSKYDKDMVTKFAQKLNANKTLDTAIMDQDNTVDINVWDFGGQFVFYATHQIFHSKSAIYLLVFNLKESFDSMLIDEDFPNNKYTLKSCLTFWMESIHSFVGSDDGKEPTVILVGTHKGDCGGKENEQLEAAMDIICETKTINHVYPTQFATECMDPHDESFEQLRNAIYKLGLEKTQHRMIPAKWIPFEKKLLEIRNKKIVRLIDILKIDSENSHPIQDEEQVKLFLKYHHEKGSLIFFDEEKLHEFIVLDPQFLIDAFKCIITSRRFYRWKPKLKELGDKLMSSGILELKLLEEIWGNDETNQFSVFQDVLLAFMERLRILAEMKDVTEATGVEQVERCFLVPSLLKGQVDERVIGAFLPPCKKKSNISLVLGLEKSSILPLVYQRVMAAVLAKWPPVYFPKSDPLLYRDIGVFRLNYQHAGLIAVSSGGLEMTVVNLCLTSPEDAVCDQFRRYVEKVVLFEFGKFSSGSEKDIYKYYLRCNHSDHGHKGSLDMHELEQVRGHQEVHCPDYGNHVVNMRESVDQWFKKDTLLLDDTIPDRELTDKDLSKIAQAIGKNWKLLGIDLGLGQDDIEQCEIDNITSGVKTTIYYILKQWRKRYPEQNSLKVLIKQMKECEDLTVNWDKINNLIDNF